MLLRFDPRPSGEEKKKPSVEICILPYVSVHDDGYAA